MPAPFLTPSLKRQRPRWRLFAFLAWAWLSLPASASDPAVDTLVQEEYETSSALCTGDRPKAITELNQRIASLKASGDRSLLGRGRLALHYVLLGSCQRYLGFEALTEPLAQVRALVTLEELPFLVLRAEAMRAYSLYIYQRDYAGALALLEQIAEHPHLNRDLLLKLMVLGHQLDIYYDTKALDHVAKPLFQMAQLLTSGNGREQVDGLTQLKEEMAYHSEMVGDIQTATQLRLELIEHSKANHEGFNVAANYCNLMNMRFISFAERVPYAKEVAKYDAHSPCIDVAEKIQVLDEIRGGDSSRQALLGQFNPIQQLQGLNFKSYYYAGLGYLALGQLEQAARMAARITDPNEWRQYDLWQQIYHAQQQPAEALKALQTLRQLEQAQANETRTLTVQSYQTRLELEQQKNQAAEQQQQQALVAALNAKADARLQLVVVASIALGSIAVGFVWYWRRMTRLNQHLRKLSNLDSLTGLLNRRAWLERLRQAQALASRERFSLQLAVLDLDHFKQINDRHGHPMGDMVLRHFAMQLKQSLRDSDVCGRFGGEEFVVFSSHQSRQELAQALERILQQFNQYCQTHPSIGFAVTLSAGIASVQHDLDLALRQADEQLYRAKAQGRARVCQHQPAPAERDVPERQVELV